MHGETCTPITARVEAYRQLTERGAVGDERPVRLVSRLAGIDRAQKTVRAIAYPAWDPPLAGEGVVSREDFERYVDTWGTYMRSADVRSLAEQFLQAGARMDTDHSQIPDAIHPTQSWIVRESDPEFGDWVGSWAVESKVYNPETWDRVEAGELNGYSIMVYASFRTVEVDVEGVGRVKVGEFQNPYPKFLSLVDAPAIREGFRSASAQADADGPVQHVVRCAPHRRDEMSEQSAPRAQETTETPAQGTETAAQEAAQEAAQRSEGQDLGLFQRFAKWWAREGQVQTQREQLVERAHKKVSEMFASLEPRYLASAAMSALDQAVWEISYDSDLDLEGKKDAIVTAFREAMEAIASRLTTQMVDEMQRATEDGELATTALERAVGEVQRKGAKIAKARLDKLVAARDALSEIIDEASATETSRSAAALPPPGTEPPTGAEGESARAADPNTDTEETEMTEAERKEMQDLREEVQAARAEIAELKRQAEAGNDGDGDGADDKDELEALRSELAEMKAELDAVKRGRPAPQGDTAERGGKAQPAAGTVTVNGRSVSFKGVF